MTLSINKLIIEDEALNYPLTEKIRNKLSQANIAILKKNDLDDYLTIHSDKNTLALRKQQSHFFHVCPGTKHYLCCGYYVLESGYNCPFNCSYCFLKFYQRQPSFIHFVNTEDLFKELNRISCSLTKGKLLRVGTGEYTDSLALDPYTDFSEEVINRLSPLKNIIFEFKTKSCQIDSVLKNPRVPDNIVFSWSMNPKSIIEKQELNTADLEERLNSALAIQKKGYLVGIHFDPIFYYANWEKDYRELIDFVFSTLDVNRIAWISLGIFRFQKDLSGYIYNENPYNPIIQNEFVTGKDGKNRLFLPIRLEIYKKMIQWIKNYNQELFIYLCMESFFIWKNLFQIKKLSMHKYIKSS